MEKNIYSPSKIEQDEGEQMMTIKQRLMSKYRSESLDQFSFQDLNLLGDVESIQEKTKGDVTMYICSLKQNTKSHQIIVDTKLHLNVDGFDIQDKEQAAKVLQKVSRFKEIIDEQDNASGKSILEYQAEEEIKGSEALTKEYFSEQEEIGRFVAEKVAKLFV